MQTLWLCFTEPELLLIKVKHCQNGDFRPFLLPWPSYTNMTRIPLRCAKMNFFRRSFHKLSFDRQRDRRDRNYTLLCLAGGQVANIFMLNHKGSYEIQLASLLNSQHKVHFRSQLPHRSSLHRALPWWRHVNWKKCYTATGRSAFFEGLALSQAYKS